MRSRIQRDRSRLHRGGVWLHDTGRCLSTLRELGRDDFGSARPEPSARRARRDVPVRGGVSRPVVARDARGCAPERHQLYGGHLRDAHRHVRDGERRRLSLRLAGPRRRARRVALRRAGDGPRPLRRDGPARPGGAARGRLRAARAADGPRAALEAGLRGRVRVPRMLRAVRVHRLAERERLGGANGGARRVVMATARARRKTRRASVYDRRTRA